MGRPIKNVRDIHPIVAKLRQEREDQGLTQTHVAQRMGNQTAQAVSAFETGQYLPNIALLERWSKALGYDLYFHFEARE